MAERPTAATVMFEPGIVKNGYVKLSHVKRGSQPDILELITVLT